jgi:hypothetical protein
MAASKNFPSLKPLPSTSYQDQVRRAHLAEHWLPHGIERYKQTVAELASMPVLGDMGQVGVNADRYQGVGPLETDIRP